MPWQFTVEFTRKVEENLEKARANFPDQLLIDQLRKQFLLELRQNPFFTAVVQPFAVHSSAITCGEESYRVTFTFDHVLPDRGRVRKVLQDALQSTYDRYNMTGKFFIVD
jgi:hypothetical protein